MSLFFSHLSYYSLTKNILFLNINHQITVWMILVMSMCHNDVPTKDIGIGIRATGEAFPASILFLLSPKMTGEK